MLLINLKKQVDKENEDKRKASEEAQSGEINMNALQVLMAEGIKKIMKKKNEQILEGLKDAKTE